jgi:hypothetical protein
MTKLRNPQDFSVGGFISVSLITEILAFSEWHYIENRERKDEWFVSANCLSQSNFFFSQFPVIFRNHFQKHWTARITTKFLIISTDEIIMLTKISRINNELLCVLTNSFISFFFKLRLVFLLRILPLIIY